MNNGSVSDRWTVKMSDAIAKDTLCSILQDINIDFQRLIKVIEHLNIIGDRLQGQRPTAEKSPSKLDTPPYSVYDELKQKRLTLQRYTSQLEEATARIDNVIGGLAQ